MADTDANDRHGLSDRSTVVSPSAVQESDASTHSATVDRAMTLDLGNERQNSTDMMQGSPAPPRSGSVSALDRSTYIGSADAANVADLSPWGSPLTVWNRLVGITHADEDEPPLRFYIGRRLEPIILDLYAMRVGKRPDRVIADDAPPMLSAAYPFIGAHPDFDHLEIKTARSGREWGDDGEIVTVENMAIPLHYYLQVQHQLFVTGWSESDIAVLIGHDDFRAYTVPANAIVIERLVAAEVELWGWAQEGVPPPRSDKKARDAYLRARFADALEPERPATPEDVLIVDEWLTAKAELVRATDAEDRAAFLVKQRIGESMGFAGIATYKSQTRRDIDTALLRKELAAIGREDIIERSTRSTMYRVLRPKERKEDAVGNEIAASSDHARS